ncbi:MAG: CDP-alcohol phosphatidyltransferase family protein [Lysobacterales bacterium]|jgi:phosphatidylglycerophosphate synthase|nr:MAG: CDP-alcohol phosphatidyltransferase family protein [Xanthomonadales bacterium]
MAERRPIATRDTHWARALAARIAATGLTANAISLAGAVFAALAGAAFWLADGPHRRAWLVVAAVGIQLRLLCNMLDGMVAVEHGRATPTGALYNDVPDRVADTVILVGAGYAAVGIEWGPGLGWACAVMAMLTAFVRVLGGSLGTPQYFFGPQSKSQRMAVLTAAALAAAMVPSAATAGRIVTFALVVVLVGSAITAVRRLRRIAADLERRDA